MQSSSMLNDPHVCLLPDSHSFSFVVETNSNSSINNDCAPLSIAIIFRSFDMCNDVSVDVCVIRSSTYALRMLILDLHFKPRTNRKLHFMMVSAGKRQTINFANAFKLSRNGIPFDAVCEEWGNKYFSRLPTLVWTIRKLQCLYYLKSDMAMYIVDSSCMLMSAETVRIRQIFCVQNIQAKITTEPITIPSSMAKQHKIFSWFHKNMHELWSCGTGGNSFHMPSKANQNIYVLSTEC